MMELTDIKGLGKTRLEHLRAMGIESLRDLLYHFPVRFEDHVHCVPLDQVMEGAYLIRGVIREKLKISYFKGSSRITGEIWEGDRKLSLCWFNEPWIIHQVPVGSEIRLFGSVRMNNGRKVMYNPRISKEAGWIPVYRTVKGVPGQILRQAIQEVLSIAEEIQPESLPQSLRKRYGLIPLAQALRWRHCPETVDQAEAARRRLDFEQMILYLTAVYAERQNRRPGYRMEIQPEAVSEFWDTMPFEPTEAQVRVLQEIASDLCKEQSMARLVQGDVGCGKTAIAFGAIFLSWKAGFQSAMMAPTEILARQHFENAVRQLAPLGIQCALLTGRTRAAERRRIISALKNGSCHALFGTHALISADVAFQRLGLVITDEQHRFGVKQRSALQEKGVALDQKWNSPGEAPAPHVLVMSATPIPRTLALILYGDLDLSIINELPPGRKPVKTRIVPQAKRSAMYQFARQAVKNGQQIYVICPLVESDEDDHRFQSMETLHRTLAGNEFKGLRIGKTWGGQPGEEKAETLRLFASGELDVLVATTVIEVGINVPNATIMIIENAERFGLSQLHQLRGRVGRGEQESWCFLRSDDSEKIKILCETGDGFAVAQKDLEMRGPGELMGNRQSGESDQLIGRADPRLLDEAQRCVREVMNQPELSAEKNQIISLTHQYFQDHNVKIARN